MAVAVFSYPDWTAMFPEMANVPEPAAAGFFAIAGLLLDNTDCSPVQDVTLRTSLLYYATAHVASLAGHPVAAGGSAAPSGVVGRVSSATEGTVSVSTDYGAVSGQAAWWLQSAYGATFWQLAAAFRTMRYVAPPPRVFERSAFGRGFGGRFGW